MGLSTEHQALGMPLSTWPKEEAGGEMWMLTTTTMIMIVLARMKEKQAAVDEVMMMARVVADVEVRRLVDVMDEGPGRREHLHGSDRVGTWPWSPTSPYPGNPRVRSAKEGRKSEQGGSEGSGRLKLDKQQMMGLESERIRWRMGVGDEAGLEGKVRSAASPKRCKNLTF